MSGLIYLVIIGMWAAYLLPMWLRSNDPSAETERLSTAMRVLARRSRERQDGLSTPASEPDAVTVEVPVGEQEAAVPPGPRDAGHSRLVVRRRRLLLVLLLTTVVLVALHAAGLVYTAAVTIAALLLLVDLVHLRVQARRRAELAHRRRRAHRTAAARRRRRAPHAPVHVDRSQTGSVGVTEPEADGTWEPRPVPLPTYVTAPKAPAASAAALENQEDSPGPGTWEPPAPQPYGDPRPDAADPDEGDPLFERRVVND